MPRTPVKTLECTKTPPEGKVTSKLTRSSDCQTHVASSPCVLRLLCLPLAIVYSDDILRTPLTHATHTPVHSPLSTKNCLFQGLLFINLEGQFFFTHEGKECIFSIDTSYAVYGNGWLLQNVRKGSAFLKQQVTLRWHLPCGRHDVMCMYELPRSSS